MTKLLTRVLLIHWHFYTHQLIEFERINFLTGKTGSGKSTIIDALQVLLLGDTNARRFFNKAANDRSERTLEGYLAGEYGEDGDRLTRSLRQGRFTSYIAGEFRDDTDGKVTTLGIVFDTYEAGNWAGQWFLFKQAIPDHHFINPATQTPMDIQECKNWLRRLPDTAHVQLPSSNEQYRSHLTAALGGLRKNYFSLFRKAVSFSPIQDIETFITQYICDVNRPVDIYELKENLRHYRTLENQAQHMQEQILHLQAEVELYQEWQKEAASLALFRYLLQRGELAELDEQIVRKRQDCQEKEAELAATLARIAGVDAEITHLQAQLAQLDEERYSSDIYRKSEQLRTAITQMKDKVLTLQQEITSAISKIRQMSAKFQAAAGQAAAFCAQQWPSPAGGPDAAAGSPDQDLFQPLRQIQAELADPVRLLQESLQPLCRLREDHLQELHAGSLQTGMQQLALCLRSFVDSSAYHGRNFQDRQLAAARDEDQINRQLAELRAGIKQYPHPKLKILQGLIASELAAAHHAAVPVWIVADELEILDPRWTDALEGYLHTQKFNLLVAPLYFDEALRIYERYKAQQGIYDIGLIDIARITEEKPCAWPGSLAAKVQCANEFIRIYVDFVLGEVQCCDQVDELRKHKRAITDTCMLYQGYVARQLNPGRYRDRFIGKSAIRAQITALEYRQQQIRQFLEAGRPVLSQLQSWTALGSLGEMETEALPAALDRHSELPGLLGTLSSLQDELGMLDLAWLDRLMAQAVLLRTNIKTLAATADDLKSQRTRLEVSCQRLLQDELPELERQAADSRQHLARTFQDQHWLATVAEPRFAQEHTQRGSGAAVRSAFLSPQNRSESQMKLKWEKVQEKRSEFNQHYQASASVIAEHNRDYEQRLLKLSQEKLPEYLTQIQAAQKLAYEQFQSDFLVKIQASIQEVTEQIKSLNRTLKDRSWGTDRFQFVVEPNPNYRRFYDMIMDDLLMQGYTITYMAFREKHGETVDELFRQIMAVDDHAQADQRSTLEKNIETYCNYRTYLNFDLHAIDENNEVQRLSRTLLKKSGGETQTPYYISMLAAFAQLYRINDQNRSCLRLIIFDEAFSKMDGERIRESISLLRRIGFQCILSAPPEKIGDITPLVDRNICVLKQQRHSFIEYFDKQVIDRITCELADEQDNEDDEDNEDNEIEDTIEGGGNHES